MSSHVAAAVVGSKVVVAVTGKRTALCNTFVEVFMSNASFVGQDVQVRTDGLVVEGATVHRGGVTAV